MVMAACEQTQIRPGVRLGLCLQKQVVQRIWPTDLGQIG